MAPVIRTCIASRTPMPAEQLLRVVEDLAQPGVLLPDPKRCLPGRGAWITPTVEALNTAETRHAFARALRVKARMDTSLVREYLLAHSETKKVTDI